VSPRHSHEKNLNTKNSIPGQGRLSRSCVVEGCADSVAGNMPDTDDLAAKSLLSLVMDSVSLHFL